jgi:hypothetical protein
MAFKREVEEAARRYRVLLRPLPTKPSPAYPGMLTIDFEGTVMP